MLTIHVLIVGQLQTNCYLVSDPVTHETLVIDPADASEYISEVLGRESLHPIGIVATHGHFDHILGAFGLQMTYRIPFYVHGDDKFLIDRMQTSARHFLKRNNIDPAPSVTGKIVEGAVLDVGKESLRVLHTPGHTPGSITLIDEVGGVLLVGDLLFADGAVGRTDHTYSHRKNLTVSIARVLNNPVNFRILSGHGEETTVKREKVFHVI